MSYRNRVIIFGSLVAFLASDAWSAEVPQTTFYSGNDVYGFCQHDRAVAYAYVAGLYDEAAHAAFVVDTSRPIDTDRKIEAMTEAMTDSSLKRIVGYCAPEHATFGADHGRVLQISPGFSSGATRAAFNAILASLDEGMAMSREIGGERWCSFPLTAKAAVAITSRRTIGERSESCIGARMPGR